MVVFDEEKQNKKLDELRKQEQEEVAQSLSGGFGVGYIDLTQTPINSDALRVVTAQQAEEGNLAVFDILDKKVKVAVLAPENEKTQALLEDMKARGFIPTVFMTSDSSLKKAWARYKDLSYSTETKGGALDISNDQIGTFLATVHTLEDVKKLIDGLLGEKKTYQISHLLEIVLAGAMALGASDIHIEPEEKYVRIRYRLDGVLVDVLHFEHSVFKLLLSRLKLLSGMKLNVGNAQDGRFSIHVKDVEIEIRASILPSAYDESVVMRILNPASIDVPLESLGIPPKLLEILLREIDKPEGMVLTTGPTGSGKTTTLYAFLKKIYSPDVKIITIEDPVEYHLAGLVQTQTNADKGYTFAEGLRSAVRQDPDIIMVGEIRDSETANIAIDAALTGHLVFSTLHTNSAAATFPRLIDLGVNPKVISPAITVAMAQRLVRKLCPVCKKKIPLEGHGKEVVQRIVASFGTHPEKPAMSDFTYGPVGCDKCSTTGYKGRAGIYEAVLRSEAVEQAVINNPSEREIQKAAEPQGLLTLRQDGIIKILAGLTSFEELQRVIDLEEAI